MHAMSISRAEIEIMSSQLSLQKDISAKTPSSARHVYKHDDEVLVFSEEENTKWAGPFKIIHIEGK